MIDVTLNFEYFNYRVIDITLILNYPMIHLPVGSLAQNNEIIKGLVSYLSLNNKMYHN